MKLIPVIFTLAVVGLAEAGFSQGFVNLNFERATFTNGTATVPGWTAYIGTSNNPTLIPSEIYFDTLSLGGAAIILEDSNYPAPYTAIQGNYSLLLMAASSIYAPPDAQFSASIGQTGAIPITSKTLFFWGNVGGMEITFNGQPLSFVAISNTVNCTVWGADISAYAGQTGQLLFTGLGGHPYASGGMLDNIQFSSVPIPEPNALALTTLGALFLGFGLRRR